MSSLSNYHTHARYCDGEGDLVEYVENAIEKRMGNLGFSCHAPVPFETDWTMAPDLLPEYLRDGHAIKEQYKDVINIFMGLEVDYIPDILSPRSPEITELDLDYTIGSVHFLGVLENGNHWTVDGPLEELEAGLEYTFGGSAVEAASLYYERLARMALSCPPDIVGHFDLIKKNNTNNRFFSEEESWYKQLVRQALKKISQSPCLLEVNTGGILRYGTPSFYPSPWILRECLELDIPVVVSSDAHRPSDIDGYMRETFAILKQIGYRAHHILTNRGWIAECIS